MQGSWTRNQWKLIEWLATPRMERMPPTMERLAQDMGVHYATLWRWRNLDGFQDEVNTLARASVQTKLPEIYGALLRAAEKESFQHIKLVLELAGDYKETQNVRVEGDLNITADDIARGMERLAEWKRSKNKTD